MSRYTELKNELWLVHNSGGIDLTVVRGPFDVNKNEEWKRELIKYVGGEGFNTENDTMHTLSFTDDGPELGDFSGGFMDAVRILADPESYEDTDIMQAKREVFEDA